MTRITKLIKPLAFSILLVTLFLSTPVLSRAQEAETPPVPVNNAGNNPDSSTDNEEKSSGRPAIPQNPVEILETLGYVFVIPFLLASVIAVWFSIERLVVLRRGRVIPKHFVERFLELLDRGELDPQTASDLCLDNGSPIADIFDHGVRKWGKSSVEIEQAIIDGGERQVGELRRHLRIINGVATVSPLMGLFGTVVGMIEAFNQIAAADAMGKTEELAVGIATALLTTAAGLFIAIPSLIMYMYLSGRVDALVMEMDRLAQNLVDYISAESMVTNRNSGSRNSKLASKSAEQPKPSAKTTK